MSLLTFSSRLLAVSNFSSAVGLVVHTSERAVQPRSLQHVSAEQESDREERILGTRLRTAATGDAISMSGSQPGNWNNRVLVMRMHEAFIVYIFAKV